MEIFLEGEEFIGIGANVVSRNDKNIDFNGKPNFNTNLKRIVKLCYG